MICKPRLALIPPTASWSSSLCGGYRSTLTEYEEGNSKDSRDDPALDYMLKFHGVGPVPLHLELQRLVGRSPCVRDGY